MVKCHRNSSADELEGRIVAEILRNSDRDASIQAGGIHDYDLRSGLDYGITVTLYHLHFF